MARTRNSNGLWQIIARSSKPIMMGHVTAQLCSLLRDQKKRQPGPRFHIPFFGGGEGYNEHRPRLGIEEYRQHAGIIGPRKRPSATHVTRRHRLCST